MARPFRFNIPANVRVLTAIRMKKGEIPCNEVGEPLIAVTERVVEPCRPGKIIFGGKKNHNHTMAFLSPGLLIQAGFQIESFVVVSEKDPNSVSFRAWWKHVSVERGLEGETGVHSSKLAEMFMAKLGRTYHTAFVYDNGDTFSVNLSGHFGDAKFDLIPVVVPAVETEVPTQGGEQVAKPLQETHAMTNMQLAFLRSQIVGE